MLAIIVFVGSIGFVCSAPMPAQDAETWMTQIAAKTPDRVARFGSMETPFLIWQPIGHPAGYEFIVKDDNPNYPKILPRCPPLPPHYLPYPAQ
jgi:hypothetical protein